MEEKPKHASVLILVKEKKTSLAVDARRLAFSSQTASSH